jgi:hypothetical protein
LHCAIDVLEMTSSVWPHFPIRSIGEPSTTVSPKSTLVDSSISGCGPAPRTPGTTAALGECQSSLGPHGLRSVLKGAPGNGRRTGLLLARGRPTLQRLNRCCVSWRRRPRPTRNRADRVQQLAAVGPGSAQRSEPPVLHPHLIGRTALLDCSSADRAESVVANFAWAGYGKTMLHDQAGEADIRPRRTAGMLPVAHMLARS